MPLLVTKIGVGSDSLGAWLAVMGSLSALAIPATLLEYYFTRERITEEKAAEELTQQISMRKQLSACFPG